MHKSVNGASWLCCVSKVETLNHSEPRTDGDTDQKVKEREQVQTDQFHQEEEERVIKAESSETALHTWYILVISLNYQAYNEFELQALSVPRCRWEAFIYLLICPVLWPEVTARLLKLEVEMGKSVQQVHPPRWRITHYRSHGEEKSVR